MNLAAQLGEIALALIVTVAVLLACAWLVKRTQGGGISRSGGLRVVSTLSLGTKERLCVVEVGERQLVLGVTPSSVTLLQELTDPISPTAAAPDGFAGVLRGVLDRA